ncbi:roadblock/LC7 domain-containing protein [Streptomyces sp. NPDC092296]|uniref:roadblock/LC7 domain-containing protein n=1 Tax=Streptomyces sp. NPDC092296 TaxID=3366012 RepID=UPI0038073F30
MMDHEKNWPLQAILDEVSDARTALLVADDGLVTQWAGAGLDRDEADRAAAVASSAKGACAAMAAVFAGVEAASLQDVVVRTADNGYILLTPTGRNSTLAVHAGPGVRLEQLAYVVRDQIGRLAGKTMAARVRTGDARS